MQICQVYDVIFNSGVVKKSEADPYIFGFMVQVTIDRIKQKYNHDLSLNFTKLKNLKYKGKSVRPQRIRARKGPKIEEVLQPEQSGVFNNVLPKEVNKQINENVKTPKWDILILKEQILSLSDVVAIANHSKATLFSKFSMDLFKHNMDEKGRFLYYDGHNASPKYGQALIVCIELNLLAKSIGLNLNVTDEGLALNCSNLYKLKIAFPFRIDSSTTSSYFDTSNRICYIHLPFYKEDYDQYNISQEQENQMKQKAGVLLSDDDLYDVIV